MTDSDDMRAKMVQSLLQPAAYSQPPETPVAHISTHISDVFLVNESAFKVKKPVNFGFCNFSTPELRRQLSEREIELNSRLSHDVYLSVEPVNYDAASDTYNIVGAGEQVDCALRMRRLQSEDQLDRLLESGDAGSEEIGRIALLLAEFHANAPEAADSSTNYGSIEAVSAIVLGNLDRVAEHAPPELDAAAFASISAYSNAFLEQRGDLIRDRYDHNLPRMCHGDLHAGNIFLERTSGGERAIQIIDCIEFNDSFVYIDPAADIAFLSMDLKRRGYPEMAAEFVETYVAASGDRQLEPLLPFYESYRAMVRCMAASISAEQADPQQRQHYVDDAIAYLQLAGDIASQERHQFLAITAGVTGTGKSTVARLIATQWNALHLNTDTIRRELAGVGLTERTGAEVMSGIYSSEMSGRVYDEMQQRARNALADGKSVVMDGTHLMRQYRENSLAVGDQARAQTIIVECVLEEAEALRRLKSRYASGTSESEGRPEVYARQIPTWEQPERDEANIVVQVDTGGVVSDLPAGLFKALWNAVLSPAIA